MRGPSAGAYSAPPEPLSRLRGKGGEKKGREAIGKQSREREGK